jgi:excisionase family DNA binding protein
VLTVLADELHSRAAETTYMEAMAGSRIGLHDHPIRPALTSVVASSMAAAGPAVCLRNAHSNSGPKMTIGPVERKGCAVAAQPMSKTGPDLPGYLRAAEVADLLQVSPKTVSRWAKEEKLPFPKTLGGHRRYPAAEIRQLADQLWVQPTT